MTCSGVWSDKAKEPSLASPLPLRRSAGAAWVLGAEVLPLEGWALLPPLLPHPRSWPRLTVEPRCVSCRCSPGGGGRTHSTVAKVMVLLGSPWQRLPWTAPHHCLPAVAQATHGLSWLLQLWGTQALGVGDGAGRSLSAGQQCWDWGGFCVPSPGQQPPLLQGWGLAWGKGTLAGLPPGLRASHEAPQDPIRPPETHMHFWGGDVRGSSLPPPPFLSPASSLGCRVSSGAQIPPVAPPAPGIPPAAGEISGRR